MIRLPLFVVWLAAVVLSPNLAHPAEPLEAPFGVKWGLSADEVRAIGVTLDNKKDIDCGIGFSAKQLPKILIDVDTVELCFWYNDKLWQIRAGSIAFNNDPYAFALKTRYDQIDNLLSAKYGPGKHSHYQDTELWSGPDEFLSGIENGRSWHYTNYESENVFVQLGLRASSHDTGYFVLIFENTQLKKDFEAGKQQKEQNAL